MDNYSNNSEQQSDIFSIQPEKPKNRNKFASKGLCLTSDFPGGNLHTVAFKDQIIMEGKLALLIQFSANSDTNSDVRDKAWFYFTLSGIRETRNLKYSHILFRFKNANIYKKFMKEKKFKPYVAVKQHREKNLNQWKTILLSKITQPADNEAVQAQFVYKIQPGVDKVSFASNLPYNLADFQTLNRKIIDFLDTSRNSMIYYHREIIAQSVDGHPVYMLTVTSTKNVESYNQEQREIWPHKGQRPYLLKNKPEIVITARVHPSQISSSFCVEGIIESLVKNKQLQFLLTAFIFRIIPVLNPDGVENGHYRLDNYSQNLNRFYGHSDHAKTPSIYAVQKLLVSLRSKSKLFLFLDIHGHNSPKPSFIFGNYSQNFYHALENKTFARIMQALSQQKFSFLECEFSKRNMSVKEKYDEHSKEASARVFAYQGNCNDESYQAKNQFYVEHSYTLQVHPYFTQISTFSHIKNESKQPSNSLASLSVLPSGMGKQPITYFNPSFSDIVKEYKKLGQNVLISILELIGANAHFKLADSENGRTIRRKCLKQVIKLPEHYDRFKKQREKQREINRQLFERYYKKWNLLQSFKQFLSSFQQHADSMRKKFVECPIYQIFQEELTRKDSTKKLSPVKFRTGSSQMKSKQKIYKKQKSQVLLIGQKQDNKHFENQFDEIHYPTDFSQNSNETLHKNKISQQNAFILMQNKLLERIENFYINSPIRNSPRLVNYTPTFNSQKKNKKSGELQNLSELEKRAKRLIFRHKTQMQTKDTSQQMNKKNIKVELSSLEKSYQKNNLKSQKYLFEADSPFVRNLEPLSKKKSKQIRMKGDQYNDGKQKLNNILFKNQNSNRKELPSELKARVVSTQNPKIQQLLRRVSLNKNEDKNSGFEDDEMIPQINKLKGTKTILSNLILLRSKSKMMKGLSNGEKQDIIHSISNNCIVYDTNNSLIPLMHQSKAYEQIVSLPDGSTLVKGLQGSYRSICPIPNKDLNPVENQIRQITSVQIFKKNNLQFLEKAKNELLEKKKIFKSIQR